MFLILLALTLLVIFLICLYSNYNAVEDEYILIDTQKYKHVNVVRNLNLETIDDIMKLLSSGVEDENFSASRNKRLLYYARVSYKDKTYYKVGVTSTSFFKRFHGRFGDYTNIELVKAIEYEKQKIDGFEKDVLDYFHEHKLFDRQVFDGKSGWTEVFNHDVLNLDHHNIHEGNFNGYQREGKYYEDPFRKQTA